MAKFGKHYPSTMVRPRRDREKLLLVAAGGLTFSLLIIFLVLFQFRSDTSPGDVTAEDPAIPSAVSTVTVYTPERFVRSGTKLSEVKFKEIYWPSDQIPVEAVRNLSDLAGKFAKQDLVPGNPVLLSGLTDQPLVYSLPLTPGNRAVAIEIDSTTSQEAFTLPGTRVDVTLTYHVDGSLTSKVIVENARVLSYGGDQTPMGERMNLPAGQLPKVSRTITLDVSPSDALKIQTSRQLGTLSLLLRSPGDDRPNRTLQVDQNAIDDNFSKPRQTADGCRKGRMTIEGKEYYIDCDGSVRELVQSDEP